MKKLILGTLVSLTLIWFSLKGVEFDKVITSVKDLNLIFVIPASLLFLLTSFLRSLRWGVILSPLVEIRQKRLFPISCVGYMGTALIPMRIGELVRPYLVSAEAEIPMSSALATIVLERIFDGLTVLSILFLTVFAFPDWMVKTGYTALAVLVVLVFVMLLFYFKTEASFKFSNFLLNRLTHKFRGKSRRLIYTFIDGFSIISSPKQLIYTILLSILIWGFFGLGIFMLFFSYNFQLSMTAAFVILVFTIIGISFPAAPGMVGNFHFACIVALSLFGIPKSDALGFSGLYHLMAIGKNVLLGLIFLPVVNFSFKRFKEIKL